MGVGSANAGPATGDACRFAAFISYSHADADAAAKLQRKLERYRLPKRIAEARASEATALGPIFRDREDLAAAASLSAAIRDAIGRAEALIVMCSPDAVASPWVAAEIDLFRELHPDKPILAALLSGEPSASFPTALTARGNEPLAADLRSEGDGEQLGFLKIVAGIAGVPLDALIQRDAQRRLRRVTAITAGALAAMLIMGIMTTYALQARNEAARQTAAAEGLVEYMLTDLREKLKGVGRLDVMDAVNERAMAHYNMQGDLSNLSADSLERRARILHAMGEDNQKQGQLDKALAKFQEAHRTTATLLKQEPENADRIFAHAQSEYWVGYVYYLDKDWAATERHWRRYKALADQLVASNSGKRDWLREAGYAEGNLCTLALDRNAPVHSALPHCQNALSRMKMVLHLSPGNGQAKLDIANRYAWLADALKKGGEFQLELGYRQEAAKLADELLADEPRNMDYKDMWVSVQMSLASAERAVGQQKLATSRLIDANRAVQQMVKSDPSNQIWRERARKIQAEIEILGENL